MASPWRAYVHDSSVEPLRRFLCYTKKLYNSFEAGLNTKPENVGNVHEPEKIVLATLAGQTPNLISSEIDEPDRMTRRWFRGKEVPSSKWHAPVIDMDIPCRLLPSSTPGHYHLYIDQAVPWDDYLKLLEALEQCGFLQYGFLEAARKHRATYLRWGTTKQKEAFGG